MKIILIVLLVPFYLFGYECVNGVDGKTISTKIPLDVEVELDENVIKSLKTRTEMCRVPSKGNNERLEAKPTFFIEKK